jgi:hypothetical protein
MQHPRAGRIATAIGQRLAVGLVRPDAWSKSRWRQGTLDAGARCAHMFFFFSSRAGIGGSILISLLLSLLLLYACSA